MNPDNVFQKNQNPVTAFMDSISVDKVDEYGRATGTTGGAVHMWNDDRAKLYRLADEQRAQYNELLGASQGGGQPATPPAGNAFLQAPGTTTPTAAPMASNAFLGASAGPSSGTGQSPSLPMIGRPSAPAPAPAATPLSTFGKQVLASPTPISQNGAIFSGEGGQLSITQDPNTIPAQAPAGGGMHLSPGAGSILARGVTQFTGPEANNQFLNALDSGAYKTAPIAGASPEEVAAVALKDAKDIAEVKAALPRMALPNTGNKEVDANRNNAFLKMTGESIAKGITLDKLAQRGAGQGGVDYEESMTAFNNIARKNGQVVTTQVQLDKNGRPTVQATFHDAKSLDDGSRKKYDELSKERTAIASRLAAIDMNTMNNAMAMPQKKQVDKERKRLAKIEEDLNGLLPGSVVPYGPDGGNEADAKAAPGLEAGKTYPDANGNLAKFKGGDPKSPDSWEPVSR